MGNLDDVIEATLGQVELERLDQAAEAKLRVLAERHGAEVVGDVVKAVLAGTITTLATIGSAHPAIQTANGIVVGLLAGWEQAVRTYTTGETPATTTAGG